MRLAPLWFLGQLLYNYSLSFTSMTSSTIISNSSSLFTLVFSVAMGSEHFTFAKAYGVALALAGAIVVALGDKDEREEGKESMLGDVAALISA
ncbi:unnamed protein product, partial [Discosporangium mesarthrocarpum]